MKTQDNEKSTEKKFWCSFGSAGFGISINSRKEITYDLLSAGIGECMCHEYEGEISVEDALESCGIHKEDYDDQKSYEAALRPLLKLYAKDNLSPITLNCTLDDKPYKISEKIRTHLENNYLDFVVEWIITEMYWIDTNN